MNTQVQSCDNVCIFVAMATFPKWCPVWLAHVAVSAIFKTLVFITKGIFQPMQQL